MDNCSQSRLSVSHSALLGGNSEGLGLTFECQNGWEGLIDGVLRLVGRYAADTKLEMQVTTVKEKFGQLRIYHQGGDVTVDQAFDITELVSGYVCELCGKPGSLMDEGGWLEARCEDHRGVRATEAICTARPNQQYVSSYTRCLALILWSFKSGASLWVQTENIALGGSPQEALATADGCEAVYLLLKRLAYGAGV